MERAARSLDIQPRPWLGFIPEPTVHGQTVGHVVPFHAVARVEPTPTETPAIEPRRWLDFVPEPQAPRRTAWSIATAGLVAVGVIAAVLGMHGDPEEEVATNAAVAAAPNETETEEVAHVDTLSAIATSRASPALGPPLERTPTSAAEPRQVAAPAVRKQPVIEPMTPGQLRKAQRVARRLGAALADGRVETSTLSFAVVVDAEGTFFSEAARLCNELVVDGVSGWRLPSVGELRDLGRARAVPGAAYWSRTRGRDPETVRVYNTRTRRSGAWLDSDPTGSAVCVQARPRP